MSLDGAFLYRVKAELEELLIGGRVDKIHQPSKDEIIVTFRASGGAKKLAMSANPMQARVHLTEQNAENPKSPPMFCMLLRKHLNSGKLVAIKQDGLERIIDFHFECMNEMGDMVTNRLIIEIMGRASNIMLLAFKNEQWRVVDSLKRVTDEISSVRRILPNIIYEQPPKTERFLLFDFVGENLSSQLISALEDRKNERAVKALLGILEGVSPVFVRECVYFAAKDLDISAGDLLQNQSAAERLLFFLKKSGEALKNGEKPVIITEKSGKPIDFCFISTEQYGNAAVVTYCDSANALLDKFYSGRAEAERERQRSGYLLRTLLTAFERVTRKIETQKTELQNCKEREKLRMYGDLITANIYLMKKGATELVTENYLTGETVAIPLDSRLSPVQNAQKYYADYKKLDTAEKMLTRLIAEGENELEYIDSVFDAASRAKGEAELLEIKAELAATGYIKSRGDKAKQKTAKALPPARFIASDGSEILVGRNNNQNDNLTLKTAAPNDTWLHTKNIAGSHVIIKNGGNPPSENTLTEAAVLAAYCSKARASSRVPVDYTLVRYVKKPAGAKPGMVIFTNNKTLYVTPSEEVYKKLLKE